MINVPPPAYQFPPSSSSTTTTTTDLNPLSFYSFPPPSSSSSSTPSRTLPFSTLTRIPIDNNASSPPEYSQVPQTFSERCFVFGFLFPLIWLIGFSRYFDSLSERNPSNFPIHLFKDLEAGGGGGGSLEERTELARILESLQSWREEEKLWSLRCMWCFGGFLSLGLLAGIVIAAVIGKL
ncbi:hypothetical protein JCM5350_002284 [Sporobolomyces pararoseus]